MPLRYVDRVALAACHLSFSTCPSMRTFYASRALRDDRSSADQNHYETLNVAPDASPAEIKQSYYTLSKAHHPDHNPADPAGAGRRFMRISEAYAVLGHVEKRARYDHDVMARTVAPQRRPAPRGSYSSTGPAGGRPASGLSRRRGTFQGPPPSFYRSGGWGAHGVKRRAAHEQSTEGADDGAGAASAQGPVPGRFKSATRIWASGPKDGAGATWPGMGPGQDPFGRTGDVPHFDREGHERTAQRAHTRRTTRRAGQHVHFVPDLSAMAGFFAVCGALVFGLAAPALIITGWSGLAGGQKKDKPPDNHGKI